VRVEDVAELVADAQHRVERIHRALEDDRDLAPAKLAQISRALVEDLHATLGDAAAPIDDAAAGDDCRRAQQAARAECQRRLARAALAGETDRLAGCEREIDVVYGLDVGIA
jgi:hypothetical protein